ncbi:MAG: ABC transporter substrate-binding protein [Candidatus Methanofastidiosia archaeon]
MPFWAGRTVIKMDKKIGALAIAIILLCAGYYTYSSRGDDKDIEYTFIDGAGREVYIGQVPERIVSLASSATEVIFALDCGDSIVGRDKYSTYPEEATNIPNLGSGSSLDMEKLIELEPDLVVIWYFHDEAIQAMEERGITVMAINPKSVEDIYDEITLFGKILGKEKKANEVVNDMKDRIGFIQSEVSKFDESEKIKVYYELSKPFKSVSTGTFTDELITLAGGINIAGDQDIKYPVLSSEWIIDQNPDVIVVVSYGASVDEIKGREGWSSINAVKNNRVYPIESGWVSSNPRLILGLEQFAKWFYPELFE